MIEEVMRDPISVGMLKIDGKKIMDVTKAPAGPRVGWILHALLEEVLDDPTKNTEETLTTLTLKLAELGDEELKRVGEAGKDKKEEEDQKLIKEIRGKHWVE
jgi:hypothetical protein